LVAQKTDYFTQGGAASPLQHAWSLGVEEQYYFIWPLLLIAAVLLLAFIAKRRGRWATLRSVRLAVFALATAGALGSAVAAVVLVSRAPLDRVYYGTDTRAQALLAGAAAAALLVRDWSSLNHGWSAVRSGWSRWIARVLPVVGLVALAAVVHFAT